MMILERAVEAVRRSWVTKALVVTWLVTLGLGYRAQDLVDVLSFKTDDLVVTSSATVGTTLGVTGLSTLTGGYDSTGGRALVGKLTGTVQLDTTSSGTVNNFVLNNSTTTLLWNNPAAVNLAITGFKCGASDCGASDNGRLLVTIVSTNASGNLLSFFDNNAGSAPSNQIDTLGGLVILKAASSTGAAAALFQYDGNQLRWQMLTFTTIRTEQVQQFDGLVTFTAGLSAGTPGVTITGLGHLTLNNGVSHIRTIGTQVVPTGCGAGPAPTVSGTDIAGRITIGGGVTTCTVPFGTTYTVPPACTFSMEGGAAGQFAVSAVQLAVTGSAAGATFDYVCLGLI